MKLYMCIVERMWLKKLAKVNLYNSFLVVCRGGDSIFGPFLGETFFFSNPLFTQKRTHSLEIWHESTLMIQISKYTTTHSLRSAALYTKRSQFDPSTCDSTVSFRLFCIPSLLDLKLYSIWFYGGESSLAI